MHALPTKTGLAISRVEDLRGRDPDTLYHELCRREGVCPDPCMRDVFTAVVAFANGEPSRPWWESTPSRKARTTPIAPPEVAGR